MAKSRVRYSRQTRAAAQLLGEQVARARRERGWTAVELAERVGVHQRTISAIEHGSPTVSLGTALEAATLCGVPLFGLNDEGPMVAEAELRRRLLSTLPARVRIREEPVRDDF
jgi:transcriptional regulator with XRE-family HTH domain